MTGKETLRIGMVVVAIAVVSRADIYFSAYFLRYPPLSIFSMGLIALFLLSIIVFAGASAATLFLVATRKQPPRALLAIFLPALAVATLFELSPLVGGNWLDQAAPTVAASASEEVLLAFAGEVRRMAAEDLYDHEEASPAALEKLPSNMRTIGFLSDILPLVHVRETYVILIYGAPRISWGFVIADKLSEEIPGDRAVVGERYKRIYPHVWIFFDNLHGGFDALRDIESPRRMTISAPTT